MKDFQTALGGSVKEYLETESLTLNKWFKFMNLLSFMDRWSFDENKFSTGDPKLFSETIESLVLGDLESAAMLYCIASEINEASGTVKDWELVAYVGKKRFVNNIRETARKFVICTFNIRLKR